MCAYVLVAQSCLTLCSPMDCSSPGFSVHGILQARILEWVAIPFSRDLPKPGIEHESPALHADSLSSEPPGKPYTSIPPSFYSYNFFYFKTFHWYFKPGKNLFILKHTGVSLLSNFCHLSKDILLFLGPCGHSLPRPCSYCTSSKPLAFTTCVNTYPMSEFLLTRGWVSHSQIWCLTHGSVTLRCDGGLPVAAQQIFMALNHSTSPKDSVLMLVCNTSSKAKIINHHFS